MSDPTMDQIERGLREMTEPRNEFGNGHTGEPTDLWKRALEISRAEERAGLVHPGADRAERPRGRRLLIALNAVGVAAMILLAAGVWTVLRVAPETEKAGIASDELASAKAEAPERAFSIFADKAAPEESVAAPSENPTDQLLADADLSKESESLPGLMARSGARFREIEPSAKANAPAAASMDRQIAIDPTAAVDDSHPGNLQMMMGPEAGLTLDGGDASVMAFGPSLENAEIVIEVTDPTEAFNAVAELPDADLDEFGEVVPAADGEDSARTLMLNFAPNRLDEAIERIRGLGRVVEERREPDTLSNRASLAINLAAESVNLAAESVAMNARAFDDLLARDAAMTEHDRQHRGLDKDEPARLEAIRDSIESIARRLDEARLSMNLSRIRVTIRRAPDSDTIEE